MQLVVQDYTNQTLDNGQTTAQSGEKISMNDDDKGERGMSYSFLLDFTHRGHTDKSLQQSNVF